VSRDCANQNFRIVCTFEGMAGLYSGLGRKAAPSKEAGRSLLQTPAFFWECGGLAPLFFPNRSTIPPVPSKVANDAKIFCSQTISALLLLVVPVICQTHKSIPNGKFTTSLALPTVIDPERRAHKIAGTPAFRTPWALPGKDLSKWAQKDGSAARWKVENGYAEVTVKSGYILHARKVLAIVNCTSNFPSLPLRKARARTAATAGVFLMGLYEIQVLDSYENKKPTLTAKPRPCTANITASQRCSPARPCKATTSFFTARASTKVESSSAPLA